MLLALITAIVTSTSAPPVGPGVELARELHLATTLQRLDPDALEARFVALDLGEREACLAEWQRIAPQEVESIGVDALLRSLRARPVEASPWLPIIGKARAPSSPVSPPLTIDRERLRAGSRRHAFGAALVVNGALSVVGGVVLGAVLASEHQKAWPAFPPVGVGLLLTAIGGGLVLSGDSQFDASDGRAPPAEEKRAGPWLRGR